MNAEPGYAIGALMRRYRETLRADLRALPDGGIATLEPCGSGWPE